MDQRLQFARDILQKLDVAAHGDIRARFTPIDPSQVAHLEGYFLQRWLDEADRAPAERGAAIKEFWNSNAGRALLNQHAIGRLKQDRHEYVPWINSALPLKGANILEIGCGTGSSVMAFAEQGANVTAIDVVDEAIDMTDERMRLFGFKNVSVSKMNATEIAENFQVGQFDIIIFFAVLEHMTHKERIQSLRSAWNLLRPGAFLCVAEAPNRLWHFDDHTSDLPFFHWLPHELAMEYWKNSQNYPEFPLFEIAKGELDSNEVLVDFLRLGRGVSFHEFEIALGPIQDLSVVSDRLSFQIAQNPLRRLHYAASMKRKYMSFLRKQRPDLPRGFFNSYINIILQKDHQSPTEKPLELSMC